MVSYRSKPPFSSPTREKEQSYRNANQFGVPLSILGDVSLVHVMSRRLCFSPNGATLWSKEMGHGVAIVGGFS